MRVYDRKCLWLPIPCVLVFIRFAASVVPYVRYVSRCESYIIFFIQQIHYILGSFRNDSHIEDIELNSRLPSFGLIYNT